jgi:hypothetical protein
MTTPDMTIEAAYLALIRAYSDSVDAEERYVHESLAPDADAILLAALKRRDDAVRDLALVTGLRVSP